MDGRHHLCPLEPFDFKRLAKALPWEAPITWRRWNAHSGKIRLNCTQSITPRGPRLESANGTGTEGTRERDFWLWGLWEVRHMGFEMCWEGGQDRHVG